MITSKFYLLMTLITVIVVPFIFFNNANANTLSDFIDQEQTQGNNLGVADQQNEQQKLNAEVYRNEKYHFRIKFPEKWEVKDGDGKHIVQKAVKDNSTILVLVRNYKDSLSEKEFNSLTTQNKEDINNIELSDFSDKDLETFLNTIATSQLESFPGSTVLERGVRYVDNRKAVYFKMNQVYKVQNTQIEGVSENYFTIHEGKLFQISGFYPTVPIDEHKNESIINQSISSFVFEDWGQRTVKNTLPKISLTSINNSLLNSAIGRIIVILLATFIYLLIVVYSKITDKNVEEEITNDGISVASRIKRFMTWLIDTILVVPLIDYILMYFIMNNYIKSENAFTVFYSSQLLLFIFLYIIYYTLFEKIFGRTLGKFIIGTKVIAKNNYKKAGFGKILGRTLLRAIPFEPFSFLGKNPLGWHDKWSNTLVVNSNYTDNQKKYCKHCGNLINENSDVCNNCNMQTHISKNSSNFSK